MSDNIVNITYTGVILNSAFVVYMNWLFSYIYHYLNPTIAGIYFLQKVIIGQNKSKITKPISIPKDVVIVRDGKMISKHR